MVFILGDKKYNTETSEKVIEYFKSYPQELINGDILYTRKEATLYKTKKGNWFSVLKRGYDIYTAYKETEDTAKEILKKLNAVETYNKYFGELEEA